MKTLFGAPKPNSATWPATWRGLIALCILIPGANAALGQRIAVFEEQSSARNLDFRHQHFGDGQKYMPENMAPGVAVFDANRDGLLDVAIAQGAPVDPARAPRPADRLFLQLDSGHFEAHDLPGTTGNGMGLAFGDIDRDGDLDLYVTNDGPNVLLLNRGDGRFEKLAESANDHRWGTGATFFDPDRDGDLDLFVTNYVDFSLSNHKFCGSAQRRIRSYCHPDLYSAVSDVYYQNHEGRFEDRSKATGIVPSPVAKGLGVVAMDFNDDSAPDVYVANDSTENQLYLSRSTDGGMRFQDDALVAGLALNGRGQTEAGMGIAVGDIDGDGRFDLLVSHLDEETNTLYRNLGGGAFEDWTQRAGLSDPSRPWVGFGTNLLDVDGDGDLDLFVGNGHIIDNIEQFDSSRRYQQPSQLFENDGTGRFTLFEASGLPPAAVVRGSATGDLDRDGDPDLVLAQNNRQALLFENQLGDNSQHLWVALEGVESNPQGFGAKLVLDTGDAKLTRWMVASSSYLSQSAPEVHFGLGALDRARSLVIHWPSGQQETLESLRSGERISVREGDGIISRMPLRRAP